MTKVILVSGANRGLGLAIAKQLYQDGFDLSLGARDLNALQIAFADCDPKRVLFSAYDAKDPESPKTWVKNTLEKFGRLDGLVNNAGILHATRLENEDDENKIFEMFDVNAMGPLRLTRACLEPLKQSGEGRVVNIISLSGKRVKGAALGYPMSKFAFMAFHHSLRQSTWDFGIRATAICPGFSNTDMVRGISPLKENQMTQPEDIAKIVSTVIQLPNSASVAEVPINCVAEASL